MYNSDTELLFPTRVIASLGELRSDAWRTLVERVSSAGALPVEKEAFVLMMVRLGGCVGCNADSFRAMRGCTACGRQTIKRFKSDDQDLIDLFTQSCREMEMYLHKRG
jgi:antitoxin component of RelBE/YafQ-DinJ toxin-antitoxin module